MCCSTESVNSQLKDTVFDPATVNSWRFDDSPQARNRKASRFKANKNMQEATFIIGVRGRH